jgi:hypothetical protein
MKDLILYRFLQIMGSWVDNSLVEEDMTKIRKCMQFFSGDSGPSLVTT